MTTTKNSVFGRAADVSVAIEKTKPSSRCIVIGRTSNFNGKRSKKSTEGGVKKINFGGAESNRNFGEEWNWNSSSTDRGRLNRISREGLHLNRKPADSASYNQTTSDRSTAKRWSTTTADPTNNQAW